MLALIDDFLNRITMYRLVLYYLIAVLGAAALFGFFGMLPLSPENLAFSTAVILAACWLTNFIFARAFGAATNTESVYITALILALIISPVASTNYAGLGFLVYASAWAMASKYIFALGKKHLFNPAALGIALSALTIGQSATWWVAGNFVLLPLVFFGGLLIVRKLRRFDLVLAFIVTALAASAATSRAGDLLTPVNQTLFHSSLFFLGFVMLTEPLTMPPGRIRRIVYGAMVGVLFAPNIHIGSFYFTPELALLAGNLFAYFTSPKGRFMLTLVKKNKLANGVYEFVFAPDRPFPFRPGQYLEWTLPHKNPDARGNRRYFTIASSPTEPEVSVGVKCGEPMSSFKRALLALKPGEQLSASHLSGEFTLPQDPKRKVTFIAGGIGVTPFRSMVQYMLDTKDARGAALLYSSKTIAEIAYKDIFDRAERELGLKIVYAVSNEPAVTPPKGASLGPGLYGGPLNAALIRREVPDFAERTFYISGPHGMVEAFKKSLREMGVPRWHIKVDYFPGFA